MRYVAVIIGVLGLVGCSSVRYSTEAYEENLSATHGKQISDVIMQSGMGNPTRIYKVYPQPDNQKITAYDWAFWGNDWFGPRIDNGYAGQPVYRFHGRYCLTTLYVDEDHRVVSHRFQGVDCVAAQKRGPRTVWVYERTQDITAEERESLAQKQREVDEMFADYERLK